ncbi:hypothetical protein F8M41_009570 [Gigaspora margarita]|uniref:Uncharacterized protein n=1 Tax=Gigaspora margarita TaxID=4874 RepID=A0A8H3X271_GIGMA|nr:hypothetical protein F8M41_009570 [Gigaspora margarita]
MSGHMCSICLRKFTSDNRPSNENTVNLFSRTSKKISISSIKFGKQSHKSADNFIQIVSKEENLCNISKDFEVDNDMSFELEDKNDMSFEVAADNNEEFFEILQDILPNFKDIAEEIKPFKSCNKLSSSNEDNSKKYKDFPNEAYADLMALVTKFKLKDKNDMSFEVAADNNEEFFEILQDILPNFKDIAEEIKPFKSCNKLSSSNEDNSKKYKDFPNEAYADLMALISKSKLEFRTHQNMQNYLKNDEEKLVCIESVQNYFWRFNNINIYEATVIDRMHHLDLGLYNHQITFTCDLLKSKYGHLILDKIDNRLANIPRHSGLKIFKNGIQTANTANEYRNLMKIMIFVLDDLTEDNDLNKILMKVYEDWNNMYLISRYEEFSEKDLENFEKLIRSWAKQFVDIF